MKIGLSLSRCVLDIYNGDVDINDILVIVARTDFDPEDDSQWQGIWQGYHIGGAWNHPEWVNVSDEHKLRQICIDLKNTGRLHQPRQFGHRPRRLPYYWLEAIPTEEEMTTNPAVLDAWQQFKTVAGLTGAKIRHDQEDLL